MNIIYPPLVEQMYKFMHEIDKNVTKQDVYKKAIEANMIDYQGNPTKWAIKHGYIAEIPTVNERQAKLNKTSSTTSSDKDLDEVFSRMPPSAFTWIESQDSYAMDTAELKKAILSALKDGNLSATGRKNWLKTLDEINLRER